MCDGDIYKCAHWSFSINELTVKFNCLNFFQNADMYFPLLRMFLLVIFEASMHWFTITNSPKQKTSCYQQTYDNIFKEPKKNAKWNLWLQWNLCTYVVNSIHKHSQIKRKSIINKCGNTWNLTIINKGKFANNCENELDRLYFKRQYAFWLC